MKNSFIGTAILAVVIFSSQASAQTAAADVANRKEVKPADFHAAATNLYLDVHHLGAGKVDFKAVAGAHLKDLAVQGKYGVQFIKFWVDEANGNVYCLSSSPDSQSIRNTHAEAHGLLPDEIMLVSGGEDAPVVKGKAFFLDVHELGAGNVKADDVAAAHQKDLAVEKKYGVNFINYWVNEKDGVVVCLSQSADSASVSNTHREAHGLVPVRVIKVKQGK